MNTSRIRYVDGLRAIAVLAVVAYHSAILQPHLNRGGIWNAFLGQGSHGVELFFVLSGFCLAYPTLEKLSGGKGTFNVARYAAHRLVRIAPPYYIALGVFAVFSILSGYHPERVAPFNLLQQVGFIDNGTNFVNPSFWTLPIEMRWYFLLPVALWVWVRAPKVMFLVIASLILAEQTRAASTDVYALPAFLAGVVSAELYLRPRAYVRFALPLFIVALAATMLLTPTRNLYGRIEIGWEITAALLVIAAGATPWIQRLLALPALTFIGAASYSIYLMHEPIMDLLESDGVAPGLAAVAGIVTGILFWTIAERPFIASPLRDALLSKCETFARRLLPALGIAPAVELKPATGALAQAESPVRVAAPAIPAQRLEAPALLAES